MRSSRLPPFGVTGLQRRPTLLGRAAFRPHVNCAFGYIMRRCAIRTVALRMTLGNMHALGITSNDVTCQCGRKANIDGTSARSALHVRFSQKSPLFSVAPAPGLLE